MSALLLISASTISHVPTLPQVTLTLLHVQEVLSNFHSIPLDKELIGHSIQFENGMETRL